MIIAWNRKIGFYKEKKPRWRPWYNKGITLSNDYMYQYIYGFYKYDAY